MRALLLVALLALAGCTWAPRAAAPCGKLDLSVDPDVLRPGESATIRVAFTNCGAMPFLLRPGGECYHGANLDVVAQEEGGGRYELVDGGGLPHETPEVPVLACSGPWGEAGAGTTVPPGGTARSGHVWNGSAVRMVTRITPNGSAGADVEQPLPAGRLRLFAQVGEARAAANLTLDFPVRATTRLLATDEGAHGLRDPPACAQATLGPEGLTVRGLPVDEYALLRRFSDGTSEYAAWSPAGGAIVSAWNPREVLAQAFPSGDDLWVNGTRLAPGESTTLNVSTESGTQALVLHNEGEVRVTREAEPCAGGIV